MSGEWLTTAAYTINGLAAAATPYLVGAWLVASCIGAGYSYALLRKARRDQAYQRGRGTTLEYSARSSVGRVWIRTKTFIEFLVIGLCSVLLLLPPPADPLLLLLRALARLLYLGLFISVIAQLTYNARRDDQRDGRLREMLEAQHIAHIHELREKLAAIYQPLEEEPPTEEAR
jgi:drug/metabolite transporter (DMT)-like permease